MVKLDLNWAKDNPYQKSLIEEVDEINALIKRYSGAFYEGAEIGLYLDNEHTDYSPERTDPCPDYYGSFQLRWNNGESICDKTFVLKDIDDYLYVINNLLIGFIPDESTLA